MQNNSERKKEKERDTHTHLYNEGMDTCVSPGRQQHVTHYTQRLEKSLVFLLQSHHMKTNTALVKHRTDLNELRSINTDIGEGNHSGTGKLNISASGIPGKSRPAWLTTHTMTARI